ncbi:MAG: bacteriohemerythrin [Spirochaetales bacterium]|nr:bacteriohemerythrin [Spirochaetales bacterium]
MWKSSKAKAVKEAKALKDLQEAVKRFQEIFGQNRLQVSEQVSELLRIVDSALSTNQAGGDAVRRAEGFNKAFQTASTQYDHVAERMDVLKEGLLASASAAEQTSAAAEEMAASIERISQESSHSYTEIQEITALTRQGQNEMSQTSSLIRQMTSAIGDLRGFIEVIDDIAAKTSILAINAAIQAAHAGVAGRGFAVVADEVRKLAESSSKNAESIARRMVGLISDIGEAEKASDRTSKLFGTTEQRVQAAAGSFLEIEQGTKELAIGGREILSAVLSLRENTSKMHDAGESVVDAISTLRQGLDGLKINWNAVENDLKTIRTHATEVNFDSLTISQSFVSQIQTLRSLENLETSDLALLASELKLQHSAWSSRIRAAIDGRITLKSHDVSDPHTSALGSWLHSDGKSLLQEGVWSALKQSHQAAHEAAVVALAAYEKGELLNAENAYQELSKLSKKILEVIDSDFRGRLDSSFKPLVSWGPDLQFGLEKIDQQHHQLVDLINELHKAVMLGKSKDEIGKIVKGLADYTVYHFTDEEKAFQNTPYPYKDQHVAIHKKFVNQVVDLQSQLAAGKTVLGSDTLVFLKDWLVNHIQGTDRIYVEHVLRANLSA